MGVTGFDGLYEAESASKHTTSVNAMQNLFARAKSAIRKLADKLLPGVDKVGTPVLALA